MLATLYTLSIYAALGLLLLRGFSARPGGSCLGFLGIGSESSSSTKKTVEENQGETAVQGSGQAITIQGKGNKTRVTDHGAIEGAFQLGSQTVEEAGDISMGAITGYNQLAELAFGSVDQAAERTDQAATQAMERTAAAYRTANQSEASQTIDKIATYGLPALALLGLGAVWLVNR